MSNGRYPKGVERQYLEYIEYHLPHVDILKGGRYRFDVDAAERPVEFIETRLKHIQGKSAGAEFILDDWQRAIIYALFGTMRHDNTRRFRVAYIEVPRKAGKSTLAAGIALYLLFADGERGAQIYSAAVDRDQARVVFDTAKTMVAQSPGLAAISTVMRDVIVHPRFNGRYKVLSADAPSKHGLNAHGVIFDELHAQPNRELYDVLHTSTIARLQPVEFYITTAGYDRNSICWEEHVHAQRVIDGTLQDDAYLGVIYAAGENDDWTDPAVWRKAHPGIGSTVPIEHIEQECMRAKEMPAKENTFKRLYLNVWTVQDVRWMSADVWNAARAAYDEKELLGKACYGGLDLSTTTDLTALSLVFPMDDGTYRVVMRYWIPADNARQREHRDRVPYSRWISTGLITATSGNVVDYDVIRRDINELAQMFDIREIRIDRWNATQIATQLQGDGLNIAMMGQGFASMSNPTKELMTLILGKRLLHNGNEVLAWNVSNVSVKQDPAGNIKPDKATSNGRIDGAVALIMGLSGAMVHRSADTIYNEQGIKWL